MKTSQNIGGNAFTRSANILRSAVTTVAVLAAFAATTSVNSAAARDLEDCPNGRCNISRPGGYSAPLTTPNTFDARLGGNLRDASYREDLYQDSRYQDNRFEDSRYPATDYRAPVRYPEPRYQDTRYEETRYPADNRLSPALFERPAQRGGLTDRVPNRDELDRLLETRLNGGNSYNYRSEDVNIPASFDTRYNSTPRDDYRTRRPARSDRFDNISRNRNLDSRDLNSRDLNSRDYNIDLNRVPLRTRDDRYNAPTRNTLPLQNDRYQDNRYEDRYDTRYTPQQPSNTDRFRLPVTNPRFEPAPQDRYSPTPSVRPEDQLSDAEKLQLKLSARYGNPVVLRFVQNVNAQQAARLFQEASTLIDSRHFEPTSYDVRVRNAGNNLVAALKNPQFVQAMRINPTAAQVQSFQNSLQQMTNRSVRTAAEATQVMYQVANMAQQQVGIPATATVLEFVYGSAESLDKYSTFLPEEPTRQPGAATGLEDNIVGIGVEIKPHDQGVEIVRPLRGGPAEQAGVKAGDIISAINGRPLAGQNLNYAVDMIAGPVGSSLNLSIIRDGRPAGSVSVTRRNVRVYSVSEVRMDGRDKTVGYIKLDKFAQSSSKEMDEALWKLHNEGMQSLVIDLRGNPGGLLTTAIELSNKFLPSGTIVSTKGRNPQDQSMETATYAQTWKVPLVVLIDDGSASASEIFAAAIQENRRGVIVGRTSYGKGTVQTHFPLSSVTGNLKLTTAKFYSPNGREMAGSGVTPDIEIRSTAFRGESLTSGIDRDIQAALEIAESDRVREIAANGQNVR